MSMPEKKAAVFRAVLHLLRQGRPLGDLKVSEIAEAAGIGKGTVYEYFASKDEILQGMALYCFDTEIARIAVLMEPCTTLQELEDAVMAYLQDLSEPDGNLSGDRFQYWRTGEPPRYGRVCASPAWGAAQNHGSPAAKRGDQPRPAG